MKTLITGGAGFIGSHLAARLIDDGGDVVVLDDLSTGSLRNLDPLRGRRGLVEHVGSVNDEALVRRLVEQTDATIHLAAAVGVRLIVERPVHTIETNVHGTQVVLAAAATYAKPVLVASTSEVYGKAAKLPFREDDDLVLGATCNSRWAYACSKALDEWLALAYARERGVSVVIARLFNTAGPRQTARYGMVLPTFAAQAVAGRPITVFGTGEQTRCFVHVRDVVEAIVRLIAEPAARGEVFNVGTQREIAINELARMVRKAAGSLSEIVRVPYTDAYTRGFEDMARRIPDVRKLERTIGYKPTTELEQIVADVIADARASGGR
jgi:UDP-glucose 4-epimerase